MVRSNDIRANPSSQTAAKAAPSTTTSASTPPVDPSASKKRSTTATPTLTPEEEAERERKRKRNEKKTERRETKAQEASNKANSWQKFAKKGAKKGYGIAGEKSMFKTPDDPYAKGEHLLRSCALRNMIAYIYKHCLLCTSGSGWSRQRNDEIPRSFETHLRVIN